MKKDFIAQATILFLFVFFYYIICYFYNFLDLTTIIKNMNFIIVCYALGYSITCSDMQKSPYRLLSLLIAMILGYVFFAFLSVYRIDPNMNVYSFFHREARNIWRGSTSIAPTLVGIYGTLGESLLPVLFFGKVKERKKTTHFFFLTIIGLLCFIGLYTNVVLQNRAHLVILIASFFFSLILYFMIHQISLKAKFVTLIIVVLLLGMLVMFTFKGGIAIKDLPIVKRLKDQGLETTRPMIWAYMLEELPFYLYGGRKAEIGEYKYVHNLWLDVAYDAGVLPFFFLLLFHFIHLKSVIHVIFSDALDPMIIIFVICLTTSLFLGFMVEPILRAPIYFFSSSCFYLGVVRKMDRELCIQGVTKE